MVNQKENIFGRFFEKQRKTERRRKKKEIKRVHEGKPLTGVEEKKDDAFGTITGGKKN